MLKELLGTSLVVMVGSKLVEGVSNSSFQFKDSVGTMISAGILGNAANNLKGVFNFK